MFLKETRLIICWKDCRVNYGNDRYSIKVKKNNSRNLNETPKQVLRTQLLSGAGKDRRFGGKKPPLPK